VGNRAEVVRFYTSIYFIKPLFDRAFFTSLKIYLWLFTTDFSPDLSRKTEEYKETLKSFERSRTRRKNYEDNLVTTEDVMIERNVCNCKTGKLEVTEFTCN